MTTKVRIGATAAVIAALLSAAQPVLAANICAPRKITATGASSNLAFFARSRARTAWTAKVSRETRLGPNYAQWLRSRERRVVCRKLDTQTICIAAALPCRRLSATADTPLPAAKSATARPL